ncbi:Glycosyltransferase involved in cell wall bisynthesis [Rubritalea squalenifaciens DSM 18772]|uniref:Glycosyltransferase involved in cell wall bisynthesis n=1 Tax=Rubritalea squalenifaciens DSM 18772 TaxID=1123071 RepID=A0A1M6AVB6_9BACT|nr:glycosyltransferase [Rubritalea squalenifaciens]SHI40392.1 Glycosyltransferase involved in cell wall bisynthesis [Rubritalea squalenifaciens DSM 18772]
MQILITSPYPLDSPKGNSITALRIERLLKQAGHQASAVHGTLPTGADAMIALHATKTYPLSAAFKQQHPGKPLILYLTGTDLYRDLLERKPDCLNAMELADILVVSQPASLSSIPEQYQQKSRVVRASIVIPKLEDVSPPPQPSFALVAHLRPVKNPFLLNRALEQLGGLPLHAYTLGSALDEKMIEEAHSWQAKDPRFRWLDNVPYPQALSWISQVTATINSSHLEGGANAVGESILLGTPVLASKIEGNLGMLGDDYAGYFTPDDPGSLATIIRRVIEEPEFLQLLRQQIHTRQTCFSPAIETQGWLDCLTAAQALNPRPSGK